MAIGDCVAVTDGDCTDLHYVDTGMYGTAEYGSVYIIDAERPAIVDSGTGKHNERVLAALEEVGIAPADLEVIALTHVHLDHAGGAAGLIEACPNATVAVHESGARHVHDPGRLIAGTKHVVGDQWKHYGDIGPVPEARTRVLGDDDAIDLGDHELRVHPAPGHAPHQVVFEDPANEVVFTADAAGIYVPTLDLIRQSTPPSNFDLEQALSDVSTIQSLDPEVLCFGHFGPALAEGRLAEYADVLAEWVAAVAEKRAELDDDGAVEDYFAARIETGEIWGEERADAEERLNVRGVLQYLDGRDAE